eukprot:755529-Hanusia_phi.AAC.9
MASDELEAGILDGGEEEGEVSGELDDGLGGSRTGHCETKLHSSVGTGLTAGEGLSGVGLLQGSMQ